jgi:hypothetical protein
MGFDRFLPIYQGEDWADDKFEKSLKYNIHSKVLKNKVIQS